MQGKINPISISAGIYIIHSKSTKARSPAATIGAKASPKPDKDSRIPTF